MEKSPAQKDFCQHLPKIETIINLAAKTETLHKEQCTDCFLDHSSPGGIDLCLTCFNGACVTNDFASKPKSVCGSQGHCLSHRKKTNHNLALNIKKRIEVTKRETTEITKIAINTERGGGDGLIEIPVLEYSLQCYICETSTPIAPGESPMRDLIRIIEDRTSSGMSNKIKAWELEILPCDHSRNLAMTRAVYNAKPKIEMDFSNLQCSGCNMKTNIWLCLICGNVGCGRKHYDGSGGNGHGKDHNEKTKHPLAIKLGTLGGTENASAYCYLCNNDVRVENLMGQLVPIFGEKVKKLRKTEKTINQMSLEINLNFELSKAFEEKEQLTPLNQIQDKNFFWGIANIGNSCYMNSVVQAFCGYPEVIGRLLEGYSKGKSSPMLHQIARVFEGIRRKTEVTQDMLQIPPKAKSVFKSFQYVPRPYKFRELIAGDHSEFKTARQQDAAEYFLHFLSKLSSKSLMVPLANDFFRVPTANKLECSSCKSFFIREGETISLKVELPYQKLQKVISGEKKVNLKDLLGAQGLENGDEVLRCEKCKSKKVFDSKMYLRGFPENLVMVVRPFYMEGLMAKKMDMEIVFEKGELVEIGDLVLPKEQVIV